RQELAAALARTLAPGSTGDAGTIVRSLFDKTFAAGTEGRMRLGRALVQSAGGDPRGVSSRVLETVVSQALRSLARPVVPGPPASARPAPAGTQDLMERGAPRRFAHDGRDT